MITVAYDGSGFHGWQTQLPPDQPPLRTVQGVLEEALRHRLGQPIRVGAASRTDAGVHARGQVAHFDADTRIPESRLAEAITSRLPEDVEVREARIVPDTFHATRDAIEKQYRYRIWNTRTRPLGERHLVYPCSARLDLPAMQDGAARLVGEHDFASFATAGHGRDSTVREIYACQVQSIPGEVPEVHLEIRGNGFLWNMIRIIAGTLLEIGRGRWRSDRIDHLLSDPDREAAGPTLPPQGLCLEWVRYPPLPPAAGDSRETDAHRPEPKKPSLPADTSPVDGPGES